jgi:predicted O-linked N-acetylglucosamine transferase (SPINDLY family)
MSTAQKKIKSNDPCPCGSGKKYKRCCGQNQAQPVLASLNSIQQAQRLLQQGRLDEAEKFCLQFLQHRPDDLSGLQTLAEIYFRSKRHDQVIPLMARHIQLTPKDPAPRYFMALTLQASGKTDESINYYRATLELDANHVPSLVNLGCILHEAGRSSEAIPYLAKADKAKPNDGIIKSNLGLAYSITSNLKEAEHQLREAIRIGQQSNEKLALVENNLGNVLYGMERWQDAIDVLQQAIKHDSTLAGAYNNMGLSLQRLDRFDEAIVFFRKAIALNPKLKGARSNLAATHAMKGDYQECARLQKEEVAQNPYELPCLSNLFYNMALNPNESIAELHKYRDLLRENFEAPLKPAQIKCSNTKVLDRKIRIGYLSPDFRNHAVMRFIHPILQCHDREKFEIFCYHNHADLDQQSKAVSEVADYWLHIVDMTDTQLAECIRLQKIDILVDLAGHTAHGRLRTMMRRPAPIQMTYLGYPGSTWAESIQYRITDEATDPPGSEGRYSETLLRLPDSLWCYAPIHMEDVSELPALTNGYLTFGSFNNVNKIDQRSIDLWAKLLTAIPGSRLLLVTVPPGDARDHLINAFGKLGITSDRLSFEGRLHNTDFYHAFSRIDIALDPVSVNGATTTCEALWMGVPTLSLVGNRFLERAGLSILRAAGLANFACTSEGELIALAQYFDEHRTELASLRASLREQTAASKLMDKVAFTRNLELLYMDAWQTWCEHSN